MKYKIEIIVTAIIFIFSSFIWHSIYAQDFSPLGKLAQDYILRLNSDSNTINTTVTKDAVVVNSDAVIRDVVSESINTISKTVEDLTKIQDQTVIDIKTTVKEGIDDSIVQIRQQQTDKPAFELQRAVDAERTQLFENVTETIQSIPRSSEIESTQKIQELRINVDASLVRIKENLETESGLPVNFEKSQRGVRDTLLKFQEALIEKQKIIESRQGDLVFKDSDDDGISDYDETYIYKTDPNNARTKGEGKTDGEKISEGINPLSDEEEKIEYQDPREDKESFVSDSYKLEKVQLIKEDSEKLVFEGTALPNTYITLFVYSTPIIVTVKTNENGVWSYELDKELDNGEHKVYVATVDTTGKIVARSNPILFTKTAEAATIGIAGTLDSSVSTQNFLKDNFILITLAALIAIVILGMMFVGNHENIRSAVSELKNEVDNTQ